MQVYVHNIDVQCYVVVIGKFITHSHNKMATLPSLVSSQRHHTLLCQTESSLETQTSSLNIEIWSILCTHGQIHRLLHPLLC